MGYGASLPHVCNIIRLQACRQLGKHRPILTSRAHAGIQAFQRPTCTGIRLAGDMPPTVTMPCSIILAHKTVLESFSLSRERHSLDHSLDAHIIVPVPDPVLTALA